MTWEFLFFTNLTLLLRLRLLHADAPAPAYAWWNKAAIEITALLLVLDMGTGQGAAVAVSLALNIAAVVCDRRLRERNLAHLLLAGLHVAALSYCLGPASDVAVRPWLAERLGSAAEASALGDVARRLLGLDGLRILLGLLVVANEANLFVRWILNRVQLRPGSPNAGGIDASEYARGRVIGLLERVLIYFFVLNGQYGAVGFTLAAKGFTRFKELENRGFAEYVLIGTLLSSGLAMLVAVAVRTLA